MQVGQEGGYELSIQLSIFEIYFNLKITFPIIQLPEYLISTISIIDPDGGMCNRKRVEAEGT